MNKLIITSFTVSAMAVSTSFAWESQITNFFFGNKGEEATSQSWSLISNWSTSGSASAYPSVIPGTSTDNDINGSHKVVFSANSNKNGGQYVSGVTDVLDVDMDVKIHQIQIGNTSNAITNVRAVQGGSLTFLPGLQNAGTNGEYFHASIIMDSNISDFRVGSDFSVSSAKKFNGAAANPFFWQRASKNLYLGAADGMSTITINAYEGTTSTGEIQFNMANSGDIVVNGKLTTNVYTDAEKTKKLTTMVYVGASSSGKTVFQASQTNDVDTITVDSGTIVFDMKNGAKALAETNTRSSGTPQVTFRANSTVRFDTEHQLYSTTKLSAKIQTDYQNAGVIDLNNTSQDAGNLELWIIQSLNSGSFAIDFGDEKNSANILKLYGKVYVSMTNYTGEKPVFDPDSSEFLIKNFEQGKDQFLVKDKISDEILEAVYFEGAGTKGVDYEVVQNQLADGFWSLSYNAIPEPSTYAMIFGAIALGFALYRRR